MKQYSITELLTNNEKSALKITHNYMNVFMIFSQFIVR